MKWWSDGAPSQGALSQPAWPSLEAIFAEEGQEGERVDPVEVAREKGRQEGRRQGYQEGYAEGVQRGQEALREAEAMKEALLRREKELQARFRGLSEELEKAALEWALALARAVIQRELRDPAQAVLEEARRLLEGGEADEAWVSPEDYEAVKGAWTWSVPLRAEDPVARGDLWLWKEGELQLWGASRRWRQLVALLEEELRREAKEVEP